MGLRDVGFIRCILKCECSRRNRNLKRVLVYAWHLCVRLWSSSKSTHPESVIKARQSYTLVGLFVSEITFIQCSEFPILDETWQRVGVVAQGGVDLQGGLAIESQAGDVGGEFVGAVEHVIKSDDLPGVGRHASH